MAVWFVRAKGKTHGPMSATQLKQLAEQNRISRKTELANSTDGPWRPAETVRGLFPSGEFVLAVSSGGDHEDPANGYSAGQAPLSKKQTAATPPEATALSRQGSASFGQWYRATLGKKSPLIQAVLWVAYGFIWIPILWLIKRNDPSIELASEVRLPSPAEEARRQQELAKLERLQGNGKPFIDGEIVRVSGVSGLAKGVCSLVFHDAHIDLQMPSGKPVPIRYADISTIQIGGEGQIVESVDNTFMGGGFGLGGALQGAAQAMLLNMAISAITKNERCECELTIKWMTGELVMMNRDHLPEIVGQVLQPFIDRLPS
jgi:hypothetical protein